VTAAAVLAGDARWCVVEGDALDVLPTFPAASVNALVTDPPSGIAFMGAEWDRDKGGRAQWVAWLAQVLSLARAATAPGGRALVWALPRTAHWTGCAVEDAGWAIESKLYHLFGTGWPKGKSQLKPAAEEWLLARTGPSTPLNVEACRVATTGERLGGGAEKNDPNNGTGWDRPWQNDTAASAAAAQRQREAVEHASRAGRYPPNVLLSHGPGCVREGVRRVRGNTPFGQAYTSVGGVLDVRHDRPREFDPSSHHADPDGTEAVEAWRCEPGCAVATLDAQAGERTSGTRAEGVRKGVGYGSTAVGDGGPAIEGNTGTASRFFPQLDADDPDEVFRYVAKPARAEKRAGLDDEHAAHPTVKPVALMRWLIRLVTKPGDVVLDPFGGSGTTGVAALAEGRRVILVERDPRFAEIIRARLQHAAPTRERLATMATAPVRVEAPDFGPLFGGAR
jgi:site-specific DNA-methyltransferase (adenine-specific)